MRKLAEGKASVFGEPEWLQVPWINSKKDQQQIVCDFGFRLSDLLDRKDKTMVKIKPRPSEIADQANDLANLFLALRIDHQGCCCFQAPLSRKYGLYVNDETRQSGSDLLKPTPVLCIMIIGMQLACCTALDAIQDLMRCQSLSVSLSQHHRLTALEDQEMRKGLALMILHISTVSLEQSLDPGSLVRISWALGYAKQHLYPLDTAITQCTELMERLERDAMPRAAAKLQGKRQ